MDAQAAMAKSISHFYICCSFILGSPCYDEETEFPSQSQDGTGR